MAWVRGLEWCGFGGESVLEESNEGGERVTLVLLREGEAPIRLISGFRFRGFAFCVLCFEFRVEGLGCKVWGSREKGAGVGVLE